MSPFGFSLMHNGALTNSRSGGRELARGRAGGCWSNVLLAGAVRRMTIRETQSTRHYPDAQRPGNAGNNQRRLTG